MFLTFKIRIRLQNKTHVNNEIIWFSSVVLWVSHSLSPWDCLLPLLRHITVFTLSHNSWIGKRGGCAEAVSRCCRCCLIKQQDQQSRELMSSHCTFPSGKALITTSTLFCCCHFCGLLNQSATVFHQPFKNLLTPLVFLRFDWNCPDLWVGGSFKLLLVYWKLF